jgi:RNA polymerase sigma-70 factor (ECF subfamily)
VSGEPGAPDYDIDRESDLSVAFLALLERLAPEERAAFLLHDVFDLGYSHIAQVLDRTEAACRQVVHRARERVRGDRKRFQASDEAKAHLLQRFSEAVYARDEAALVTLFAPDATWTADGGGQVPAAPRPIVGVDRIVKLVIGLAERFYKGRATIHPATVNGEPGLRFVMDGELKSVMSIETDGGERISSVWVVVNPAKLGGPARQ